MKLEAQRKGIGIPVRELDPQIKWMPIIRALASASLFVLHGPLTQMGYIRIAR